jgi:ATP-dependent Lon protease
MTGQRELWDVARFSSRVILPRENEPDLEELPSEARDSLSFVLVDTIDEVFDAAFSSSGAGTNGRVRAAAARR